MKRTHLVRKIGYSMLASSLVLGLSPATFAVAQTASSAAETIIASNADPIEATDGTFTFSSTGIAASDATEGSYEIKGSTLTIEKSGVYEVTGSSSAGQIAVKKGVEGATIILNNLTLSNDGDKVVKFKAGSSGTLVLKGTNTLSSSNDKGIIKANAAEASDDVLAYNSDGTTTGGDLTITGAGTLNLKSSYTAKDSSGETEGCDGINCEGDLTVLGGTFNIDVTDDGMHADNTLTIGTKGATGGPSITITNCEEGLEGATVNLYSGTGSIASNDDGINAANKDLTSYNWQYAINIAGGTWNVVAAGDGIDSNGNLTVSGGTTSVYCTGGGNGALDIGEGMEGEIRGTFTYSGGTLLAVGSDMLVTPSTGTYVLFGGQGGQSGFGAQGGPGGQRGGFGGQGGPGGQRGQNGGFGPQGSQASGGQQSAQGAGGQQAMSLGAGAASSIVTKDSTVTVSDGSSTLYTGKALGSGSYALFMSDSVTSGTSYTLTSGSSSTTATTSTGTQSAQQGQAGGPGQQGGQQGASGPGQPPAGGQGGPQNGQPPADAPQDGQAPEDDTQGGQDQSAGDAQDSSAGEDASTSGSESGANDSAQEGASDSSSSNDVEAGDKVTAGSGASKATYKIVKLATASSTGTVTYTKSKSTSKTKATVPASVKIKGKTYKVTGIAAKAFKGTKVKTVTVKSAKLTKKSMANSLKGSKVKTVKVKVASNKKKNKTYAAKYAKYFKKSNSGKSVTVK